MIEIKPHVELAPPSANAHVCTVGGACILRQPLAWQALVTRHKDSTIACPTCGHDGQEVALRTVRAIVKKDLKSKIDSEGLRYCTTLACDIVYYRNAPSPTFVARTDVHVRVNLKETAADRLICYCLKVDEKTILDSITTGGAETLHDVQKATKANTGKACHVLNPSGVCCEPQIRAVIAKGLTLAGKPALIQPVGSEGDCCAPGAKAIPPARAPVAGSTNVDHSCCQPEN